jgi:hypothetical protein
MPLPQDMKAEAERCRRLMREIDDPSVQSTLAQLADYYDRQAALERSLEKRSFDAEEG